MPGNFKSAKVAIGSRRLEGVLSLPPRHVGSILFAHGSGSSRFSPRNSFVAERLLSHGFATLLFDLLSEDEAADRRNVFDIDLLGARVEEAIVWLAQVEGLYDRPIGLFGASTGAAAALVAAALRPARVAAVVSRGGRPDLAGPALTQVKSPTLLIVGGADAEVLELNRQAMRHLRGEARLDVIPGATHLFEEPGALEQVVDHAAAWFREHMLQGASRSRGTDLA